MQGVIMSGNHSTDVFISYSHKDSDWVRNTLLTRLEAHGFSVMIDYRDFKGGAFSIEEMQRAVEESKRVLIVLTEDYILSEWSKLENVMAQTIDPGATQRKVIPVLRKSCNIPLRLKVLNYRDLRTDDPQQWDLLIQDLI
jgi:TIR domain